MDNHVWAILGHVLLAAFLGVVGQLFRVVVGLKKESDQAGAAKQTLKDRFNSQELLTSLGIAVAVGAIAGVLAGIQNLAGTTDPKELTKVLLGFIAAGYSGTDFIEGFMKSALPNTPAQNPTPQNPQLQNAASPAPPMKS